MYQSLYADSGAKEFLVLPVDCWVKFSEPGIPKNYPVAAEVRDEEAYRSCLSPRDTSKSV
jgi:hypothetical protein